MMTVESNCKPIADGVLAIDTWSPANGTQAFEYIDISSVDRVAKRIANTTKISAEDAPSRARQIVRTGDVLVSTVRPNLNAVALVPSTLDQAIASTGYTVLRCHPKKLDNRYLFYWVQSPTFIDLMVRQATGASYPAVSDRIVKSSEIPLPPLPAQRRIADILDKADAIRRKRREALDALQSIRSSFFDEWFASWFAPDALVSHVPVSHFVKRFEGGLNVATPDSACTDTRHFILKVSAVTYGEYSPDECKPLFPSYIPPNEHLVRKGDLLISRANTTELVGATVYVDETPNNRVLPDKLWRFVWVDDTKVEPLFVWALFNHPKVRYEMGRRATGTSGSMKNISMEKVMSIRVPWPALDVQQRIAAFQRTERTLRRVMQGALNISTQSFNAIIQRAFKGEL